jgi:hypothetical protein
MTPTLITESVLARSPRSSGSRHQLTEVVSHIDTRNGQEGVNEDSLSGFESLDNHSRVLMLILLGNQRRDVGLEETNTNSKQNKSNDIRSQSGFAGCDDWRQRSGNDQDMSHKCEDDGNLDGLELS